MELRPTPESWRVALVTATGAATVAILAVVAAIGTGRVPVLWAVMTVAAIATLIPALGTLTASVDVGVSGVVVHRLGHTHEFGWDEIASVRIVERPARVPDGTEYHWWLPGRRHAVAVPVLELADGGSRELTALASPAAADGTRAADTYVAALAAAHVPPVPVVAAVA